MKVFVVVCLSNYTFPTVEVFQDVFLAIEYCKQYGMDEGCGQYVEVDPPYFDGFVYMAEYGPDGELVYVEEKECDD